MKKIFVLIILSLSIISFSGCKKEEEIDEYANHKQALSLVTNYKVSETNGFDYSLNQTIDSVTINSHTIALRIDNNNNSLVASRVEEKKDLKEDVNSGQYETVSATAYYKDNKIITYSNNAWITKDCSFNNFALINLSSFSFDINNLKNLNITTTNNISTLTFNIDDSKASSFLGITGSIKDLSFEIKTDSSFTKLISFKMSYSQDHTKTNYSFTTYNDTVSIVLPE